MQHALAIRVVVLSVFILVVGVGATSFLRANGRAQDDAALANVRAAAHAADAWYQDPFGGGGSYRKLDASALIQEAPNVSSKVHVTVLAAGRAYCLDDAEGPGHSAYYLGGDAGRVANLRGATPFAVTLVHSTVTDAAAICANASQ